MEAPNLGYLFYKEYYRKLNNNDWISLVTQDKPALSKPAVDHISGINSKIKNNKLSDYSSIKEVFAPIQNLQHFDLKTTYPGLLVGSRWDHSAGNIEGEFKIGFYFDYTSGLPVIPGSSVKGVIRSAFPNKENARLSEDYKEQREMYIKECLSSIGVCQTNEVDINKLEKEIFEGTRDDKLQPIYERDIFYDAGAIMSDNDGSLFMGDDFITPHKDSPYTNPIPIKFLKVLPRVIFRFHFDLKDGLITAKCKLKLFKRIMLDLGVGAKTAVGYGQFEEIEEQFDAEAMKKKLQEEESRREAERQERLQGLSPVERIFEECENNVPDIINKLRNGEFDIDEQQKREVAVRIKEIMIRQKRWKKQKQPKWKKRIQYIKELLGEN